MDIRTTQALQIFQAHSRVRDLLTYFCYFLIIAGLFIYVFYAFNHSRAAKLVLKYKEQASEMKAEKIMTNPRIDFQYQDGQVYHIKAKRAFHRDNQSAHLFDVSATGALGTIDAGELQINEEGDHMIFSKNPVVVLNKTDVKK